MQIILDGIVPLIALAAMEIVLGIDNLVFIAILSGKLPEEQRPIARQLGLIVALVTRVALLLVLTWFMSADQPLHLGEWIGLGNPPHHKTPGETAAAPDQATAVANGLSLIGPHTDPPGPDD